MPNEHVSDQIRANYVSDPRVQHAAELAVTERAGTVTLRGTVRSLQQRRLAVEIAQSVRGVHLVVDELRINPRADSRDDELRGVALQALMSSADVPDEQIDASVADGWLKLTGRVKRQSESNAAFEAVSGLRGVGGITNKIEVNTAGGY
jgi:osmotically-inducible protein OsmY